MCNIDSFKIDLKALPQGITEKEFKLTNEYFEDNGTDRGVGTYKAGTIAKLNGAIEESRKIAAECKLQSELNAEERRLDEELADIFLNDSLPYTRTYNNSLDEKDWKLFEGDGINSTLSVNKDELFFKSGAGGGYSC